MKVYYYKRYNAKTGEIEVEGTASQIAESGFYKSAKAVCDAVYKNLNAQEAGSTKLEHIWTREIICVQQTHPAYETPKRHVKKFCKNCGQKFTAESPRIRVCPECRAESEKANKKRRYEKSKSKAKSDALADVVRRADAAGMSYGKYQIMRMMGVIA